VRTKHLCRAEPVGGFNPRTRDGCEAQPLPLTLTHLVSIHAPVMGANLIHITITIITKVSIHAPVMGANAFFHFYISNKCFNPRTRDGCEDVLYFQTAATRVSIHAPVMGAK